MKKILVAVDGSEQSLRAAKYAAGLAAELEGRLTLVHAIEPIRHWVGETAVPWAAFEREQESAARSLLRDLAKRLDAPSLLVDEKVIKEEPAEGIAELAKEEDFHLVVVGSRGRNAVARVLLGSFADRMVHVCEKPVLVVK